MKKISETDLILNKDGSIYHLNLLPNDVADTVITVGDPDRVDQVSKYFDRIEIKKGKREFLTHTGFIGKKRLTVISTGIGTDNIDIVLNELDALVNIDLQTMLPKGNPKSIDIIRIGTSGAVQPEIPVDSLLVSSSAFGLDAIMSYYEHNLSNRDGELLSQFTSAFPAEFKFNPYLANANSALLEAYAADITQGTTLTVPGFYAPQGRKLRARQTLHDLMSIIQKFNVSGRKIANLEMETAGIYGLAVCLGHRAISFNAILANRATDTFSKNPDKIMDTFIQQILGMICDKATAAD
ncbi:MAG TPA: nucleoside phosphorylase [Mucilaginibacter sp.]|jgi:uridine phosphorylase